MLELGLFDQRYAYESSGLATGRGDQPPTHLPTVFNTLVRIFCRRYGVPCPAREVPLLCFQLQLLYTRDTMN